MYRNNYTQKINNKLNRISDNIKQNKNRRKNITELEYLLNQPYFKTRIKLLLFKLYMQVRKIDKAYTLIKELYDTTKDTDALFDFVKLLLDIGDIENAKKYLEDADYSEMKIFLLGLFNKYEGNYTEAIKYLEKLNHTIMEGDMHIELSNVYSQMGDLKKEKEELKKLFNTDKKYQAKIRIIKNAFGQNDPELPKLISFFDYDNCNHQGDLLQFKRCVKYYKYLNGQLKEEDLENYSDWQLYNYSKEKAISHINKRHASSGTLYKIADDINTVELYDYCINHLDILLRRDDTDVYLVEMPYDVSEQMGYKTNLLEVLTIPNTNNILTLYPVAKVGMYTKRLEEKKHEK